MKEYTKTVLIIEDEPAIARLLELHLHYTGWKIYHAATGLQGLHMWGIYQPTLILLDVMLPDLSGWEVCGAIRQESSVPIVMLTAKTADDDIVRGLNLGADDYLCKPFSREQLSARIEAVMRRIQPSSEPEIKPQISGPTPVLNRELSRPLTNLPATARLKSVRQQAGMSLYQVEQLTGIRWDYIQALERGEFNVIPQTAIKHIMLKYCALLNTDARPIFQHAQGVLIPIYQQQHRHRIIQVCLAATVIFLIVIPLVLLS